MEGRAIIIAACWITVALISMAYILVGCIGLYTDVAVGSLILVALIVTFGVGFGGLDQILRSRHGEYRPQARSWRCDCRWRTLLKGWMKSRKSWKNRPLNKQLLRTCQLKLDL